MDRRDLLKIVEAIEGVASDHGDYEDHAHRVAGAAMRDLGQRIRREFDVPACTCRYGHEEGAWGNKDCPRRGFAGIDQ